jgi:RimJ/RimL family protein N-acetyltransferase
MPRGQRVNLRAVKRSDISLFLRWFNDPEVLKWVSFHLPMTEMAEEKWIENLATTRDAPFVIEAVDGLAMTPIGNCGLHGIDPKNHSADFGIAIGEKDHWSKGYGTEATRLLIDYGFKELNLHRISSSVFEFNERSLRLHKTMGFKQEGQRRKSIFKNGQYWDLVEFGLLRDEWLG